MISLVLHIGSLRSLKMSLNFNLLWKHLIHWRLLRCFWAIWQLWHPVKHKKWTLYRYFWQPGWLQVLSWTSGGVFLAVPSLTLSALRCASLQIHKFHESRLAWGWSEVASPSAGLGPACSSSCSLCACYSPFCKALAIPAWALPRWFSELLLQGVLEGDWILVLLVIPSCTAELCFLCLRGESCCRWSCGYPGPQTTLYSGNQRPRISIILGVAVH